MLDSVRQLRFGTSVQRLLEFGECQSEVKWVWERRLCVTGRFSYGMQLGNPSGTGAELIGT